MKRQYEMAQLRRPPNRLTAEEYALYKLSNLSWEEKSRFLGANAMTAVSANNDLRSQTLTRDKLVTYGILRFHQFPFPEIQAVGHPARGFPGAVSLATVEEISAWLATEAQFPIFMKPIAGNAGAGSVWVDGYAEGVLQLRNGDRVPLTQYLGRWFGRDGVVMQAVARPHPDIAARFGPRLATARVAVLVGEDGPFVHRAALRIPAGKNMVDNFRHGSLGNLLGAIDIETGIVSNVIGKGASGLAAVSTHPDTGERIIGFALPDWQKAMELCIRAAPLFPGIMYQSWDIAFTEDGPQTIEVNSGGDVDVLQLASGRGVADAAWWKLFREPAPRNVLQRLFTRSGPWSPRA